MVPGYREDIPYRAIESSTTPEQRSSYWQTGAALQATDGLEVTDYAASEAGHYIRGEYTALDLEESLADYHNSANSDERDAEADIVAARITGLLESSSFVLGPAQLMAIHRVLFDGVLPAAWVGRPRTENIEKAEPILGGRSVVYADFRMIRDTLDYDFEEERSKPYRAPLDATQIDRFARFVGNVWQTHAFREGNTRTIAVFSQLYLRSMGVEVNNDPFIQNSVMFRDCLVRASYSSIRDGVAEDRSWLRKFYENVVLGTSHKITFEDLDISGDLS